MDNDRDGRPPAPQAPREHVTSAEVRAQTHRLHSRHADHDVEAAVLSALTLIGTETVLDVGSGTVSFVQPLVESGHTGHALALDLSDADGLGGDEIPGVESIRISAGTIPLPDASVDVVLSRHLLYLCPSAERIVAESARVLNDDGMFVATVNHTRTVPMIRHVIETELSALGLALPDHVAWVTTETVAEVVGRCFETVEVVRYDNELVFDEPAPLIRFAEALFPLYGVDENPILCEQLTARVRARVEDWFSVSTEPWLEPKGYSVCTARGPKLRRAAAGGAQTTGTDRIRPGQSSGSILPRSGTPSAV